MSRLVLDAGAYVAFERGDPRIRAHLGAAHRLGLDLVSTSPVIAQVWRNGRRQALLARLVSATDVEAPDVDAARRAGELLAKTGTSDVVDALVAGLVRDGDAVVTSDPDDLRALLSVLGRKAAVIAV